MIPLDALHLQLRLEGKDVVRGNLLRQVEFVPDEEMPLMVVAQLADGQVVSYGDEALPAEFRAGLKEVVTNLRFPNIDPLSLFLREKKKPVEIGYYKTYTFPESYADVKEDAIHCYSRQDPRIKAFGFDGFTENVFAIAKNEKIVSACVSARENDHCGEAWIYTEELYRHQGLAQKAVGAWAASLLRAGKVPFYSHKIQNIASANLAKRLEIQPVFEEIVISYTNV